MTTKTAVYVALLAIAAVLSWALTIVVRRYAIASQLMDRPNDRSAHRVPTPRGGGLAIVASFLSIMLGLGITGWVDKSLCSAVLVGGGLVALLGFIDDRRTLAARWRFAGHAAAVAWMLYLAGPLPPVPFFGLALNLGPATVLLVGIYTVWSINLLNFMDGIDGIAGLQAVTVALGGSLIWWLVQPDADWQVPLLFAACVGGFLFWNFPPARIFMGDAGSGFLGFVLALFSVWSARTAPHLFWAWFILGGCFMVDATTTLVRRVARGERFHEAHRNHAYQYAARRLGSHKTVTLALFAINVLWLLPFAVAVALRWVDGTLALVIAYIPLVYLAFRFKAGNRVAQES